jgi:hypothetical protein
MIRFTLVPSEADAESNARFDADGINMFGYSFVLHGNVQGDPEAPTVQFTIQYGKHPPAYYYGPVYADGATSTITFRSSAECTGLAVLSRTAEEILRFRPAPSAFRKNKARALWGYATDAVLDSVRRKWLSPSHFSERRHNRKRFLHLAKRDRYYGQPLDKAELDELLHIRQRLKWADVRFYMSMIQLDLQENPDHRYDLHYSLSRPPRTQPSFQGQSGATRAAVSWEGKESCPRQVSNLTFAS